MPELVEKGGAFAGPGARSVDQGRQVGIPTPFNDKVVELITRVPPGTLKPDPRNLEPLVAKLPK